VRLIEQPTLGNVRLPWAVLGAGTAFGIFGTVALTLRRRAARRSHSVVLAK
jgi:hypothetical protein